MRCTYSYWITKAQHWIGARSTGKGLRAVTLACAASFIQAPVPPIVVAAPHVEFDVAPTAECHDVTSPQRIKQFPNQRLIEVSLPVSVRFHGALMDDVEELAIEVNAASAGLRVSEFLPTTQLASDISHEIETTTTTQKKRSLDGSLGGTFPLPGADAVAHLTPSISAGLSNCDTATEKVNRLPPKHAVVVSGTSSEGRGVFFKLKRYSQTSLEGVHELTVTFVAPRRWQWTEIRVDCAARGERKMLWMKQDATIGQATRKVQLVESAAKPVRQLVLKPNDAGLATEKTGATIDKTAAKPVPQWRPTRDFMPVIEPSDALVDEPISKGKKPAAAKTNKAGD